MSHPKSEGPPQELGLSSWDSISNQKKVSINQSGSCYGLSFWEKVSTEGVKRTTCAAEVWRMTEYSQVALLDTDMVFDVDAESRGAKQQWTGSQPSGFLTF